MASTSELYSLKKAEPKPLPNEIIGSNGFTRTDVSTFTNEELADAGYTGPDVKPEYNFELEYLEWNSDKMTWDIIEYPRQPDPTPAEFLWRLRNQRSEILIASDWRVMPDSPLSLEKQEEWKIYRQQLRDLPSQFVTKFDNDTIIENLNTEEDFNNIIWPITPSEK